MWNGVQKYIYIILSYDALFKCLEFTGSIRNAYFLMWDDAVHVCMYTNICIYIHQKYAYIYNIQCTFTHAYIWKQIYIFH